MSNLQLNKLIKNKDKNNRILLMLVNMFKVDFLQKKVKIKNFEIRKISLRNKL
jgi:hypothetical protein